MDKIAVSIVIVTYNSKEYLIKCLRSILSSQTTVNYEIIVIDNCSTDETYNIVAPMFPNVTFIHNTTNRGFSYANNQGIKVAHGKYILLLNPDTLIIDNAIDIMVNYLESNPKVGACGCKILNSDGSLQASCFGFPTLLKEIGHLLRLDLVTRFASIAKVAKLLSKILRVNLSVLNVSESVGQVDYLLGACIMFPCTVLNHVGLLDEKIFMYIEDTEICYRIKSNGYLVCYVPFGKIIHFGGKSTATADSHMLMEYNRSRLYFYRKYYGEMRAYALRIIIIFDMLIKMILIWFIKYQSEMQQLQIRYKQDIGDSKYKPYVSTLHDRVKRFKQYFEIIKMTAHFCQK